MAPLGARGPMTPHGAGPMAPLGTGKPMPPPPGPGMPPLRHPPTHNQGPGPSAATMPPALRNNPFIIGNPEDLKNNPFIIGPGPPRSDLTLLEFAIKAPRRINVATFILGVSASACIFFMVALSGLKKLCSCQ